LTSDLVVKASNAIIFSQLFYVHYMVHIWTKSVKPFRTYGVVNYLTFNLKLLLWGQGHTIFALCSLYSENFDNIDQVDKDLSVEYLPFNFYFRPLGQCDKK